MRLFKRGSVWWHDFTVDGMRHRASTGKRDKSVAERVATDRKRKAELHGDPDPYRALRDMAPVRLVGEYRKHLHAQGRSAKHADKGADRAALLLEPFARMKYVQPHRIQERLHDLAAERDWSASTTNGYRLALSGFFGWLVKADRWPSNPMQQVGTVKARGKTRERRALSAAQVSALLNAAPLQRRVCYALAVYAGLRRGEQWTPGKRVGLHRSGVDLEAGTLTVRAKATKNARDAVLPIHPDLAALLREHLEADTRAHPFRPPTMPTMRDDLATAGIDVDDGTGVVDFHALRHTCGTLLLQAGAPLAHVQRVMRHSTPTLTANTYGHLLDDDLRSAVGRIAVPQTVPQDSAQGGTPARSTAHPGSGADDDQDGDSGQESAESGVAAYCVESPAESPC